MESVRFHLKEKIYRGLFQTLIERRNLNKTEALTFKGSELFEDNNVVSKNDLLILIKHGLVSELRELQIESPPDSL